MASEMPDRELEFISVKEEPSDWCQEPQTSASEVSSFLTPKREEDEVCVEARSEHSEEEHKLREGSSGASDTSAVRQGASSQESANFPPPDASCRNSSVEVRPPDCLKEEFKCQASDYYCSERKLLTQHQNTEHSVNKPVKSEACDSISKGGAEVSRHKEKKGKNEMAPGFFYGSSAKKASITERMDMLAADTSDVDENYDSDDSVADPTFCPAEEQMQAPTLDASDDVIESQEIVNDDENALVLEINEDHMDTRATRAENRSNRISWIGENDDETLIPPFEGPVLEPISVHEPVDYVREFLSEELLQLIVSQTNLYSVQKDPNKPLKTDQNEIEQWIGLFYYFSLVKVSNVRTHWSSRLFGLREIVSRIMSRDRWLELKSKFHLVDNSSLPADDKFSKIRPMITHLQNKFRDIPMLQNLCIDEQLVPFKGTSSLKQYMPKKPHKWGYKIFCLAGDDGVIYDFLPYVGRVNPVNKPGIPDLKASGNIVLHLCESIPSNKNHLLFFDNWFTSVPLQQHLAERKIFCCGTVRANRVFGMKISQKEDKELMKKGRGAFEERRLISEACDISYVRWYDNRVVNMLSSFARSNPTSEVDRFDQKEKKVIKVTIPNIVQIYNRSMGGVDKADHLIAITRTPLKSKKYYMKMVFHMFDMAVVNSWLLYKRDAILLDMPCKSVLALSDFKFHVAFALMEAGKLINKRGRPSASETPESKRRKTMHVTVVPQNFVRYDQVGHWPSVAKVRRICRFEGCANRTNVTCTKCNVHLCFNNKTNHFVTFHNR